MTSSISIFPREGHISADGKVIDEADGPSPRIIINILGGESTVNDVETPCFQSYCNWYTRWDWEHMVNSLWYTEDSNLALYLDFEDAKNIHVLSLDLGLWRTLEGPDLRFGIFILI